MRKGDSTNLIDLANQLVTNNFALWKITETRREQVSNKLDECWLQIAINLISYCLMFQNYIQAGQLITDEDDKSFGIPRDRCETELVVSVSKSPCVRPRYPMQPVASAVSVGTGKAPPFSAPTYVPMMPYGAPTNVYIPQVPAPFYQPMPYGNGSGFMVGNILFHFMVALNQL